MCFAEIWESCISLIGNKWCNLYEEENFLELKYRKINCFWILFLINNWYLIYNLKKENLESSKLFSAKCRVYLNDMNLNCPWLSLNHPIWNSGDIWKTSSSERFQTTKSYPILSSVILQWKTSPKAVSLHTKILFYNPLTSMWHHSYLSDKYFKNNGPFWKGILTTCE